MSCMFGERRLAQVDGDVAVVVAQPGEGRAEEIVDVAHEIDLDVLR